MRFRHWMNKPFSQAERFAGSICCVTLMLAGITAIRAWHFGYTHIALAVVVLGLASIYITAVLFRELDRRPATIEKSTGRHRADDRLEIGPKLEEPWMRDRAELKERLNRR